MNWGDESRVRAGNRHSGGRVLGDEQPATKVVTTSKTARNHRQVRPDFRANARRSGNIMRSGWILNTITATEKETGLMISGKRAQRRSQRVRSAQRRERGGESPSCVMIGCRTETQRVSSWKLLPLPAFAARVSS